MLRSAVLLALLLPVIAQELKTGPLLPHKVVPNWAQLPKGWNFGECSGVDVDKDDNVWIFNRGKRGIMQFDKNGKLLQAWDELPIKSSHGIRVAPDGNVWAIDVAGHSLFTFSPAGRIQQVIGLPNGGPGAMETKDGFNRPTGVSFAKNGDFYVSDGYVNSRVVRYNREGIYQKHWGKKGNADGEFNLVHDVAVDARGRVYVADRENYRVQVFDADGNFVNKWTGIGSPWGLYYVEKESAIYMVDGHTNRILKLNLEGQILGTLGSYGKVPGKIDFGHNIAVDSTGAIYVAEIKNWRVQKFAR